MVSPKGERTRFIADAMLGSTARKLRALGFDTEYYKAGEDKGLLRLASVEHRMILTADQALASLAATRGLSAFLLVGADDRARLRQIANEARLRQIPLIRGDSLCSFCGGDLEPLSRSQVSGKVPRAVERSHRQFFRCRSCGKFYWKGGHWKKLMALARLVE